MTVDDAPPDAGVAGGAGPRLRVLTLNVWARHGDWPARRTVLCDALRTAAPDLLALQETVVTDDYDQARGLLGEDCHVLHQRRRESDGTGMSLAAASSAQETTRSCGTRWSSAAAVGSCRSRAAARRGPRQRRHLGRIYPHDTLVELQSEFNQSTNSEWNVVPVEVQRRSADVVVVIFGVGFIAGREGRFRDER